MEGERDRSSEMAENRPREMEEDNSSDTDDDSSSEMEGDSSSDASLSRTELEEIMRMEMRVVDDASLSQTELEEIIRMETRLRETLSRSERVSTPFERVSKLIEYATMAPGVILIAGAFVLYKPRIILDTPVVAPIWKLVGRLFGRPLPPERAPEEPDYEEEGTVPELVVQSFDLESCFIHSGPDLEPHGLSSEPAENEGDTCFVCLDDVSAHRVGTADVFWTKCCLQKVHADCVRLWASHGSQSSRPRCPCCRHDWLDYKRDYPSDGDGSFRSLSLEPPDDRCTYRTVYHVIVAVPIVILGVGGVVLLNVPPLIIETAIQAPIRAIWKLVRRLFVGPLENECAVTEPDYEERRRRRRRRRRRHHRLRGPPPPDQRWQFVGESRRV